MKLATFAILATVLFQLGCQKAENAAMPPLPPQTETTKPGGVAVARVAVIAFSELAHLERAMKPYYGLELSSDRTAGCRKSVSSRTKLWKTDWNCEFADATPGQKVIVGQESVDFDPKKMSLSYDSRFETKIIDQLEPEPVDRIHEVVNTRKMKIIFDRTSETPRKAQFGITSQGLRTPITAVRRGSNWTMSLFGQLNLVDGEWQVAPGAKVVMNGALFGDDDDRFNLWASGDFNFTLINSTQLTGLSTSSTCTKPQTGKWKVKSTGGGEVFDTEIELSSAGVGETSGSTLNWPYDFCERP